jgi:hypothetical protein
MDSVTSVDCLIMANLPELGIVEPAINRISNARFVTVPADAETHGHLRAGKWHSQLAEFMKELQML